MKMKKELMKRVAAAGLAVSMVAGLTACGPTGKPEETKKEETKAEGGETSAAADKEERQQRRHVRHLWKNILISR